ncbi:unnamed protein product [Heterotrigona itama]|uniref:Uncharacterized protein n=1 Tax=Heterotrigona itama TaxID=395501 RepID=A0A6V7HF13_9HYME|nr:unnamed protein product [Heterotrigona itama]
MKKNRVKQLNVGTLQNDFSIKPYGFCCNIKDYDPRLFVSKESEPLFLSNDPTEGGPNIKFRIQEHNDIESSSQRSTQRNAQRSGLRTRYRSRSGQQVIWSDQTYGRRRQRIPFTSRAPTAKKDKIIEPSVELMICKRCRGPLRWYLEDEIAAARDIIMKKKQEIYNAEMEKNIKLAKKKEKRRRQRKKKKFSKYEDKLKDTPKEDIRYDESKNIT